MSIEKYKLTLFGKWVFIYLPYMVLANVCFKLLFSNGFTWYEFMAFVFLCGFIYAGTIGLSKTIYNTVKSKINSTRLKKSKVMVLESKRLCESELYDLELNKQNLLNFTEKELSLMAGVYSEELIDEKMSKFLNDLDRFDYLIDIQKKKIKLLNTALRNFEFTTALERVTAYDESPVIFLERERDRLNDAIADLETRLYVHDVLEDNRSSAGLS